MVIIIIHNFENNQRRVRGRKWTGRHIYLTLAPVAYLCMIMKDHTKLDWLRYKPDCAHSLFFQTTIYALPTAYDQIIIAA